MSQTPQSPQTKIIDLLFSAVVINKRIIYASQEGIAMLSSTALLDPRRRQATPVFLEIKIPRQNH